MVVHGNKVAQLAIYEEKKKCQHVVVHGDKM
jgi:hypothetical protein